MTLESWFAFVIACGLVSLIPGPSVFMVTGQALIRGVKVGLWCVLGDLLGGVVLIALSLVGVGAVLATSAELFLLVKWVGVFYVAYLGYRQIMDAREIMPVDAPSARAGNALGAMKAGFWTGVLNPKAILFYMAFLSQFIDPASNAFAQFTILTITSTLVVGVILSGYVLMAARARKTFQSENARRRFGYAGGGFMIGSSVLMATTR